MANKRSYSKRSEIRVKGLMQCPVCGLNATVKVVWGSYFSKCRSCHTRLFNHSATDKYEVPDKKGFYYHIYTVFKPRFGDDDFDSAGLLAEMEAQRDDKRISGTIREPRQFEIRRRVL